MGLAPDTLKLIEFRLQVIDLQNAEAKRPRVPKLVYPGLQLRDAGIRQLDLDPDVEVLSPDTK